MADSKPQGKLTPCPYCGEMIKATARFCIHCRMEIEVEPPPMTVEQPDPPGQQPSADEFEAEPEPERMPEAAESSFLDPVRVGPARAIGGTASMPEIVAALRTRSMLGLRSSVAGTLFWFVLANAAVLATLWIISALSDENIFVIWPIVLALGCVTPFFILLISKWLARTTHDMRRASADVGGDGREGKLIELVGVLAGRAGLVSQPEVWVYHSEDMNAFATGPSRNNALVAVSDGLLRRMDARGISAIVAHEIAHIANGDMLTMTVVQSVVNVISLLITIPLWITNIMASCVSGFLGMLCRWCLYIVTWIISSLVFILGLIVVLFYSRKREYAADALAAELVDADAMTHALRMLGAETAVMPVEQRAFATFKINNRPGWLVLFSTHPSIEDRIARLRQA